MPPDTRPSDAIAPIRARRRIVNLGCESQCMLIESLSGHTMHASSRLWQTGGRPVAPDQEWQAMRVFPQVLPFAVAFALTLASLVPVQAQNAPTQAAANTVAVGGDVPQPFTF